MTAIICQGRIIVRDFTWYLLSRNTVLQDHTIAYDVCVRMCVCVFIKLHITAQSGPVIYSFLYATHLGVTYRKHILG